MGVPALFRWLSKKYPKIVSHVVEEQPKEIAGETIPVDITNPNPNGFEYDNLYLDMNGIVHPCSHPDDGPAPETEEDMMVAIFEYTERVVNMVRPRKLLMIAVDGVAPRAKMNQQRSRRFRAAKEAKEKDEDNAELLKKLKQQSGGEVDESVTERMTKKTWDTNSITPGTPFMRLLAKSLNYWIAYKQNTDPAWAKFKAIISTAAVPGEGEHKIMEFVRSQRSSPEHDPNTRHVIYGLDADLIMLGLVTHEPRFHVLREDVFAQETKPNACRICGQVGHFAAECKGEAKKKEGEFDEKQNSPGKKPFIWLNVGVLREYLECELFVPGQPFAFDLERTLDDWVTMCYFVGNDFLPHLPSLEIREDGIDTLIAIWRDTMLASDDYLTRDGVLNLSILQKIMNGLAKQEDSIFRRRQQTEQRKEQAAKRRKLDQERRNSSRQAANADRNANKEPAYANVDMVDVFDPSQGQKPNAMVTHQMIMNRGETFRAANANKSAAAVLKEQLKAKESDSKEAEVKESEAAANGEEAGNSEEKNGEAATAGEQSNGAPASALGKRKAELMEEDDGSSTPGRSTPIEGEQTKKEVEMPPDTVKLWEEGYGDRYYEQKFGADPKDTAFRNKVAASYAEGLQWVLLYYLQGCPSWTWYYPYHYAPFAADFVDLEKLEIKFEHGRIFKPYEQLMGVMPAASNHTIPEVFRSLMTDEDSDIVDFYPEDFPIDLNGKKFAWQGVALLPFIDSNRLLEAMATRYPLLTADEQSRNEPGNDTLLFSELHPMYTDIAKGLFSKKQDGDSVKLNPRKTDALAGLVRKDTDYIPMGPLVWPLEGDQMPDIDQNQSISVFYDMPKSEHTHKSMLLRGAKPDPSMLDNEDRRMTKERAANSGRSYGGAPFDRRGGGRGRGRGGFEGRGGHRGGGGNGGGGHNGYNGGGSNFQPDPHRGGSRDDWRNPIAPHLKPGYGPPPPYGGNNPNSFVPPPPQFGAFGGAPPPPPPGMGFSSGPPHGRQGGYPPHNGGGGGGYQNGDRRNSGHGGYQGGQYGGQYGGQHGGQSGGYRGGHGGNNRGGHGGYGGGGQHGGQNGGRRGNNDYRRR